jgi:glycerol kinase
VAIGELRVGGGLANSDAACQSQADMAGVRLVRARDTETTARGVALLAGLGQGLWESVAALPPLLDGSERTFEPQMPAAQRDEMLARWQAAVAAVRGFAAEGGHVNG